MAGNSPSLMGVPAEVRIHVYKRLLADPSVDDVVDGGGEVGRTTDVTFFRTCRQIHEEASQHLYANNTFVVWINASNHDVQIPGHTIHLDQIVHSGRHFATLRRAQRIAIKIWVPVGAVEICEVEDMLSKLVEQLGDNHVLRQLEVALLWGEPPSETLKFILQPLRSLHIARQSEILGTLRLTVTNAPEVTESLQAELQGLMTGPLDIEDPNPFHNYFDILRTLHSAVCWHGQPVQTDCCGGFRKLCATRIAGDMPKFSMHHTAFLNDMRAIAAYNSSHPRSAPRASTIVARVSELDEAFEDIKKFTAAGDESASEVEGQG